MKNLALAVLLAAVPAAAKEGKGGPDPMRSACGADVERLCPESPNPGMCLHEHWDEVSEGCKAFKEGMKKQWQEKQGKDGYKNGKMPGKADPFREHCGADMDRLCADSATPGMCLHERWDEVSEGCKAFKEGMRKQWQEKNGPQGKPKPESKHRSFENGLKPEKDGAAKKSAIKFEWTNGEPKPQPSGAE